MAGEPTIAVVGANGLVGEEILTLLEERGFPFGDIRLLGSLHTAGSEMERKGRKEKIGLLGPSSFAGVDLAFFSAGVQVAGEWAPQAAAAGTMVVDLSSRFRLDPEVPLVVPEVNVEAIGERRERNIVASPSSTAIGLAVILAPLAREVGLRRVVVSTYQAVSGAGRRGLSALSREGADLLSGRGRERRPRFARPIAFNAIPQVGDIEPGGATTHELRVVEETRRLLGLPELAMAVTAVRVPVFFGYGMSVNLETESPLTAAEASALLRVAPGVFLHDAETPGVASYSTPSDVSGSDATHVGRLRDDPSMDPPGLALWIAIDNVRKGAALNAVQIGEILVRDYL